MAKGADGKDVKGDEKAKPVIDGGNIGPLKNDIVKGVEEINRHKEKRAAINDQIAAVRSDLKAKGIPKQAIDWAMTYLDWDEDKRDGFDVAYDIVREALGAPVQAQMFDGAGNVTTEGNAE